MQFKQKRLQSCGTVPITFAVARNKLYEELGRLEGRNPVVSSNHPANRNGVPSESKRRVADEGIAVYFTLHGRSMAMACDRFDNAAANMRSLTLAIEAMRQLERHGGGTMVERAFTGFLALPTAHTPWSVLELAPGATNEEIDTAFRRKAKAVHPDQGGSKEAMQDLSDARAAAKSHTACP